MFKPFFIENISLSFPHKTCFEEFSTAIYPGSRIAIIGNNGCGKSSLMKMIKNLIEEASIRIGYVPQTVETFENLSGGQRFNASLTEALAAHPDMLFLDEPTNHLDSRNRRSLMRMLEHFAGTIIAISHDPELLSIFGTLWHIDAGNVHIFSGSYSDYMRELQNKRKSLEQELAILDRQKKDTHQALMKEQERAKQSRMQGEKHIDQRKWPTMVSHAKARMAEETSGRKKSDISDKKQDLMDRLSEVRLPDVIKPKFSLTAADIGSRNLVYINDGACGYDKPILHGINFSLFSGERVAITGDNGSGKSTMIKAILGDLAVTKSGNWSVPLAADIGYLDQHYSSLRAEKTVLEMMEDLVPKWEHQEIRRHLNDFLFRKNEEVEARVTSLSGGEKARLSLALIAAKTPKLLILDEVTNNLDLETRQHVIDVLKHYTGSIIVISHDGDFLERIGIQWKFRPI